VLAGNAALFSAATFGCNGWDTSLSPYFTVDQGKTTDYSSLVGSYLPRFLLVLLSHFFFSLDVAFQLPRRDSRPSSSHLLPSLFGDVIIPVG
jgi:hypothetical protein